MSGERNMYLICVIIFATLCRKITAQNCQVAKSAIQTDFDFEKMYDRGETHHLSSSGKVMKDRPFQNFQLEQNFITLRPQTVVYEYMGKWYMISWYTDICERRTEELTDYTQNYIPTDASKATVYAQRRKALNPDECEYTAHSLSTTDTPGKLLYSTYRRETPYWVLDTDYTQYALVYSCHSVSICGKCKSASARILSRTPALSETVSNRISSFYQNICIPGTSFQNVTFTKECKFKTHWKLRKQQDCTVSKLEVQEDFDMNKYAGMWYETRWLAPLAYPEDELFTDYQHHYVITEDGSITGYVYGRSPVNPDQCFNNDVSLMQTQMPGKFVFKAHNKDAIPYWVIRTDYTQYAVVYCCYNVSSDGSCYEARSWVWSRTPTLPKHLEYEVNALLQDICVNPAAFLSTKQNDLCPLKPAWNLNNNQDCNVTSFNVKPIFDLEKFTGVWYGTRWLPKRNVIPSDVRTDHQMNLRVNNRGNLISNIRYRKGDACKYTRRVYRKTNTPGKFKFRLKKVTFAYWVADTDYETYAVMYGCERVGSDGGCVSARGSVWSRGPTLAPHLQYRANSVLQGLCTNPSALVNIDQYKGVITSTSNFLSSIGYVIVLLFL